MNKLRKNKGYIMAGLLVLFFITISFSAGAQDWSSNVDGDVESSFGEVVSQLFSFWVPTIGVILFAIAGLLFATGNPEHKGKAVTAMIGIFIATIAPAIIMYISDTFNSGFTN